MSVVSVTEDFQVQTATRQVSLSLTSVKNVITYQRRFIVQTSTVLDGPQIAMTAAGIPEAFSAYVAGNDSDASAYCVNITPTRRKQEPQVWDVVCQYTSDLPPPNTGSSGSGNPAKDPTLRGTRYGLGYTTVTRVITQDAVFGSDITNSAGQLFVPPLETEVYLPVVTVQEVAGNFSIGLSSYNGSVNANNFTINNYPISEGTALMRVRQSQFYESGTAYWDTSYEFVLDPNGWAISPLDQGTVQLITADGTYTPGVGTQQTQFYKSICDKFGQPLNHPVNLDGFGHPLPPGSAPVFLNGKNNVPGPFFVHKLMNFDPY